MKLILVVACSLVAASFAVSDCYFPFLFYKGVRLTCGSSSDCGPKSRCIYSLNQMRRVCCDDKQGTVSPQCPSGYSADSLSLPILCDPNSNHLGDCPDDYECVKSTTEYTKDFAVDGPQANFMCCKKD